jgi:hypothetical protein
MSRLPAHVPQIIAGWRLRKHWCGDSYHPARVQPGKWVLSVRRPEPGQKESTL